MNSDIAKESVSETMLDLLSKLSHKLDKTLPAILIGSIITAALYNHPTSLQIDLGIVIRNSKKLMNLRHALTCSCEEVCVSRNQLLCQPQKKLIYQASQMQMED